MDDADLRHELLREAEQWLAGDCLDHNYIDFYEEAMQVCLEAKEWDEVDRYAKALEDYTAEDPIPRCTLFINRGRALADFGRGNRGPEVFESLHRIHEELSRINFVIALPEIEDALQYQRS